MIWFFLLAGFVLLIKGADLLVDGAAALAKRWGVSDVVVGLSILAFGTSAPELVVNLLASAAGKSDLAVGNVLGSNVANILLVCGVAAFFGRIQVGKNNLRIDFPISLAAVGILVLMALSGTRDMLTLRDGMLLLGGFGFFIYRLVWEVRHGELPLDDVDGVGGQGLTKSWLFVGIGLAGLVLGGDWIVKGASGVAEYLGMSEALIGLTVVAVGTSLPEVATSAMAARKGKMDMAVGNALGSNIFNILWILGVSTAVRPLEFGARALQDSAAVVVATLLLGLFLLLPPQRQLGRGRGSLLLLSYGVYLVWLVMREAAG